MILYGRKTCPYCEKARALAESYGHTVTYVGIEHRRDIAGWLMERYQATTVPQIFDRGKYVGTYEDLKEYLFHEDESQDTSSNGPAAR